MSGNTYRAGQATGHRYGLTLDDPLMDETLGKSSWDLYCHWYVIALLLWVSCSDVLRKQVLGRRAAWARCPCFLARELPKHQDRQILKDWPMHLLSKHTKQKTVFSQTHAPCEGIVGGIYSKASLRQLSQWRTDHPLPWQPGIHFLLVDLELV